MRMNVILTFTHMQRELRRGGFNDMHWSSSCCLDLHGIGANVVCASRTAFYVTHSGIDHLENLETEHVRNGGKVTHAGSGLKQYGTLPLNNS